MLEDTEIVEVTNFSRGTAGYDVPELGVSRTFQHGETKKLTAAEVRALSYRPGGLSLLRDTLAVRNLELLEEIGIEPQPEYLWTEEDVKNVLLSGSLERLQDALEFGPAGIVEYIKSMAVTLEINDMSKRDAIFQATGFNVTRAIEINRADREEKGSEEEVLKPQRRVPAEVVKSTNQ